MPSSSPKPDNTTSDTPTPPPRLPKQKLTAVARLKSFGDSFVNHQTTAPIVFPPPSWELDDELPSSAASNCPVALPESNFEEPAATDSPEPVSFAMKLRTLIESLSLPGTSSASALPSTSASPDVKHDDANSGSPVPPGMDKSLVRMLSSEDIMNGKPSIPSGEDDKGRPGVWNILAGLKKSGGKDGGADYRVVEEDEDGVMLYAPLEPNGNSQVQLATSETILEYVDESSASSEGSIKISEGEAGGSTGKSHEKSKQFVEKHVWVPSTTQLSLFTTWWGYRIYMPPAVMAKLDSTSLKATARAAMITASLKWLLGKVPIMLVPIHFRPAVMMLKRLSPVVGYIGIFIAWSWDRVRACDKGNGVVFTATWLLPAALLPMSWDAGDIYRPIAPPKPEEIAAAEEAAAKAAEDNKRGPNDASANNGKPKEERKKSFFRW